MDSFLHPFLVSTGVLAAAELGDKTQLLIFVLAGRFRRPWAVIAGMSLATILGNAIAAVAGYWLGDLFTGGVRHWVLGLSFIAGAVWLLIPEQGKADPEQEVREGQYGAFIATLVSFFIAELGDKTQIATLALSARFDALTAVILGTSAGMILVNLPAAFLGGAMAHKLPLRLIHGLAAGAFLIIGALEIWQGITG